MREELRESLKFFPEKPGVYIMKNKAGKIIYVGKAKNLKKRVGSYFTKRSDIKTEFLVRKIHSVEPIITGSEYEALLLENTLIKKHLPHYNINLKDGKTYPVIRITNEEFPRVFRTRRFVQDGSDYFGPYTDIPSIDSYLELIEKLFPLRKCRGKLKTRKHPCLYYHIDRCTAPCAAKISREEYMENVEKIKKLLSGETDEIIRELQEKMEQAGKELRYEKAAEYRDLIQAVIKAVSDQHVIDFNPERRDYIAYAVRDELCTFSVFQMREGKLVGRDVFRTEIFTEEEEALRHFIMQYYSEVHNPPKHIYIDLPLEREPIEGFFKSKMDRETELTVAEEGIHRSIITMAKENSIQDLEKRAYKRNIDETLRELKTKLDLPLLPRRIEGFDISQLSGKYPVASMVSFFNGEPDRKKYRHFHMKSLNGAIDDYEAIREVVARRYTRVLNEGLQKPDLIVIDGGKGQVGAALEVLKALEMEDIPLFGLAKRREELVPVNGKSIVLQEGTPALRLLQYVRDESHRFATAFNKKLRQKEVAFTRLEKIPGIGRGRSRKLLQEFGSIANIVEATAQELASRTGIGEKLAEDVILSLKQGEGRELKPEGK